MDRKKIVVHPPQVVDHNKVQCSFTCTKEIEKYFLETKFWVEYDRPIDSVPHSLLVIPLLSNILPIVWASDTDLYVEELDFTFMQSLDAIKNSFQGLHSNVKFKGNVYADRQIENNSYSAHHSASLFSGGVDSLTTYIQRKEEKPYLISVWGADIELNNVKGWERVRHHLHAFGIRNHVTNVFVKSNLRSFLNHREIHTRFLRNTNYSSWWGPFQHGVGLLGLCAPISYTEGISKIYIPSTYSVHEPKLPWGSHPTIDNNVKWGKTSAIHEGYELTRQDKLKVISEFINNTDSSQQLRVCYKSESGTNCGKCEKCSRTMIGLILEGIDPNQHGFQMSAQRYHDIKSNLVQGRWKLNNNIYFWEDIKNAVLHKRENIPEEGRDFFAWMHEVDFRKFK